MKYLEQLLIETGGNHLDIGYISDKDGYATNAYSIIIHADNLDEIPWDFDTHPEHWQILDDCNKWLDICAADLKAHNRKFNDNKQMSDYPAVIYSRETP